MPTDAETFGFHRIQDGVQFPPDMGDMRGKEADVGITQVIDPSLPPVRIGGMGLLPVYLQKF